MMKKSISWMVFMLLMTAACAQAAPQLTNVTADGESLHAGEGWTVSFETTEGGALAMQLRGTEGETVDLGATQVDAGSGQLVWDGVLPDGSEAADGVYTVAVQLRNYWGEESEESLLPLTIRETNAAVSGVPDTLDLNSLDIQEAQIWEGGEDSRILPRNAQPRREKLQRAHARMHAQIFAADFPFEHFQQAVQSRVAGDQHSCVLPRVARYAHLFNRVFQWRKRPDLFRRHEHGVARRAPDRVRAGDRLFRVVGEQGGISRPDADDLKHGAPPHDVLWQNESVHRPKHGFQIRQG